MVYIFSAFLFGTACAAAMLFVAHRTLKKGNPDATKSTASGSVSMPRLSAKRRSSKPGG
jgi:hypothetical protein